MREYLQSLGFLLIESCNCGGTPTETWQLSIHEAKRALIVEIKPNRETFKIMSASPTIRGRVGDLRRKLEAEKARMESGS